MSEDAMRNDRTTIPTKPTPAMRRFLTKLASGLNGSRSRAEMGFPAYPMPWQMERAGWLTCTYSRSTREIWGDPNQIWCSPRIRLRISAAASAPVSMSTPAS